MALTTREFWLQYWENHRADVMTPVAENNLFSPLFKQIISDNQIHTTCELGGFPGSFSVYLKRKYGVNATLVDYVIPGDIFKAFLNTNGLNENDLNVFESDIFIDIPNEKYDMVFSIGLIEHFEDTKEIISLHLKYLKPGGNLVIILPNFTGINGWFQRKFDMENYKKHVIECMDPILIKNIFSELGFKNIEGGYFAKFGIWLENEKTQPLWIKWFKKIVWFGGKVFFKLAPIESKWFSPYIVVTGKL